MRSYLLTGKYYTAPDRGSPDGHWYSFNYAFDADSNEDACVKVRQYLEEKYSYTHQEKENFKNLELVSTEHVSLEFVLN